MLIFSKEQILELLEKNGSHLSRVIQRRLSIVDAFYFCNNIAKLFKLREKVPENVQRTLEVLCQSLFKDFEETHKEKASLY